MDQVRFSKSWIEISRTALRENFETLKRLAMQADVMPVIKANAYGHDLMLTAYELSRMGARWFAVDSLKEAEDVRRGWLGFNDTRIVVLGYVPRESMYTALAWDLSFVLFDIHQLDAVEHEFKKHPFVLRNKTANIHLPLETGLHREGFTVDELPEILTRIKDLQTKFPGKISIEGVQMHFANVEDTEDSAYAELQLKRFGEMEELLRKHGFKNYKKHTASSAASILYSKSRQDLIRPGIALYGLWPAEKTRLAIEKEGRGVTLKPVLSWKALIAQVKDVKSGEPVGYGLTERVSRDSKIAIIPVGYYDGYDRGLSSKGEVLIHGQRCKVLGRICMDIFMADITGIENVNVEDEVVLIGTQGNERISAEELADKLGTINYEIVARLSPNNPRIVVD